MGVQAGPAPLPFDGQRSFGCSGPLCPPHSILSNVMRREGSEEASLGMPSRRRCVTGVVIAGRECLQLIGVGNGKVLCMIYIWVVAVECTRDGVWRLR